MLYSLHSRVTKALTCWLKFGLNRAIEDEQFRGRPTKRQPDSHAQSSSLVQTHDYSSVTDENRVLMRKYSY